MNEDRGRGDVGSHTLEARPIQSMDISMCHSRTKLRDGRLVVV